VAANFRAIFGIRSAYLHVTRRLSPYAAVANELTLPDQFRCVTRGNELHIVLEVVVMRSIFQAAIVFPVLVAPAIPFAQESAPVTRAQVRAELIELQHAGYHVGDDDQAHYPDAIQAAEARVAAQHAMASARGGVDSESSMSGVPVKDRPQTDPQSIYFGQ
jgi:hypothetical protein